MTPVQNNIKSDRGNLLKGYNMLLYFAGSMVMYEPTEECITDFFSGGILKNLPVTSNNPRFIKAASTLRESCTDKETCKKSLIADYHRLFSTEGLKLAVPVSSAYPGIKTDIHGRNAGDFYNSYGWHSIPRGKVPDDHLGIELLFLTKLTDKFLQMDDEPCCCEMKKEIRRFIGDHIINWLPEWNNRMQKNAESVYYRGIANMALACVEDLYGIFDSQNKPL